MKKILIANRGEIACRVIRTAQKMGIGTVAVFSDADRYALHTKWADEAIYLGASPSSDSYLKMDLLIECAIRSGADAIHPGYGFLSENAQFARKVELAGLTWIGPTPEAIEIMGSKLAAKEAVKKFNVPLVPGTDYPIPDIGEAQKVIERTGLPVLIKASAGGGGKGMRIVHDPTLLEESLKAAISEAKSAFGDGSVFIEKYITHPRHIEFQILADSYGNTIHLFDRECSIQRRHQKVIEEAPSPALDSNLRKTMGDAAVMVAKSCQYRGAGTVEFILDENKNFYFLEMNTRLQVEHPVTEMITGIDLVEQQIHIARGEKLAIHQKELEVNGHAIELRIYAEDPFNHFLPSISRLERYEIPEGQGVRVDNGYVEGDEIPIFYDPMISKLITYGKNRNAAIEKMKWAIDHYIIKGIQSTLPFGYFVMQHPAFVEGVLDTHFIQKHFTREAFTRMYRDEAEIAAHFACWLTTKQQSKLTFE
ncbi:MAG TPA: acetyl-CoA carboxylase biotin carboxylase subunit [Saprospiraceae bacterium]|nr:acetyl-CoA carboxylase biotin carboxylase subunit [Saprospiraceae bacterium]